jgi:hypothetical protein
MSYGVEGLMNYLRVSMEGLGGTMETHRKLQS